jgi:hypothetical protein
MHLDAPLRKEAKRGARIGTLLDPEDLHFHRD